MPSLEVLYEDNHLLVVNKPAGIATMGAENGPTIHSLAADYLKRTYHKPGKAFVGIVSRLDTVTSGVLVLARTSKAASRLSSQFARRNGEGPKKIYLAVVEGHFEPAEGTLCDHLRKDDAARRMRVVGESIEGAQKALLRYMTVGQSDESTILAVELLSGRKHQIRVQFSDRGHALLGDRKYGSSQAFAGDVALHSWRLCIEHPTKRTSMWFEAPPPKTWKSFRRRMPVDDELIRTVDEQFDLHRGEPS